MPNIPTFTETETDQDEMSPMFKSSLGSKFGRPNNKKIQKTSHLDKYDREALNLATKLANDYIKLRRDGLPLNPQMAQLFKDIHMPGSLFKNGVNIFPSHNMKYYCLIKSNFQNNFNYR